MTVLDMGCGKGYLSLEMLEGAKQKLRYVLIDGKESNLDGVRAELAKLKSIDHG